MPSATSKPVPANARWYAVEPGSRPSICKGHAMGGSCTARIYFATSPQGRQVPVDCDVEGGQRPSEATDDSQLDMLSGDRPTVHAGRGVSHFLTCSDADLFSKGAR